MEALDDFLELGATVIDVFEHIERSGSGGHENDGFLAGASERLGERFGEIGGFGERLS